MAWGESRQEFKCEIRYFNRIFEHDGRLDREQSATIRRARVMPFTNPDGDELHENGYAVERGEIQDSSEYYAPDAEVFFSEAFLQHHYFRLERDDDLDGLVGIAFELTYTIPRSHLRRRHARAEVEFARLGNGMVFVQRWMIRMPIVRIERPAIGGVTRRREKLFGFKEEGSEVLLVMGQGREVRFEAVRDTSGQRR